MYVGREGKFHTRLLTALGALCLREWFIEIRHEGEQVFFAVLFFVTCFKSVIYIYESLIGLDYDHDVRSSPYIQPIELYRNISIRSRVLTSSPYYAATI